MTATTIAKSDANRLTTRRGTAHALNARDGLPVYVNIPVPIADQMGIHSSSVKFLAVEPVDSATSEGLLWGKALDTSAIQPPGVIHSQDGSPPLRGIASWTSTMPPSIDDWHQLQRGLVLQQMGRLTGARYVTEGIRGWGFEPHFMHDLDAVPGVAWHPVVQEFAAGVDGVAAPHAGVVAMAGRVVQAALARTADAEFSVDVDGALSLVLRLSDGRLMLAELAVDGSLAFSRYDDDFGSNEKHLPNATEADFINHLF